MDFSAKSNLGLGTAYFIGKLQACEVDHINTYTLYGQKMGK